MMDLKQRDAFSSLLFNITLKKLILSVQDNNLGTYLGDSIGATQIYVVSFVVGPKPDGGSKEIIIL